MFYLPNLFQKINFIRGPLLLVNGDFAVHLYFKSVELPNLQIVILFWIFPLNADAKSIFFCEVVDAYD